MFNLTVPRPTGIRGCRPPSGRSELRVKWVRPGGELDDIAKLRYAVYIQEQGLSFGDADHAAVSFTDDMDFRGISLSISKDEECLGTVRINHFDDECTAAKHMEFLGVSPFAFRWGARQVAVCSRLAVRVSERDGEICRRAFNELYTYAQQAKLRFVLIYCKPKLERFYARFGFRHYLPPAYDPIVGPVSRMALMVEDMAHFRKCRSPFAAQVMDPAFGAESVSWFEGYLASQALMMQARAPAQNRGVLYA